MNKLDIDYINLCKNILENGSKKKTRNGNVYSVFGRTIGHNMKDGFPILTTKKIHFKSVVTELLWFLKGRTDLRYLLENNCNIWTGDAYKRYVDKTSDNSSDWGQWMKYNSDGSHRMFTQDEFVDMIKTDNRFEIMWGSLGKIYGYQWRNSGGKRLAFKTKDLDGNEFPGQEPIKGIDQIANIIETLKTNPDDRRMIVNSWNVSEIKDMVLPPCHYSFQVYTRELKTQERMDWLNSKNDTDQRYRNVTMDDLNVPRREISLLWNQRSVDTPLGLPFNIASYGLLLEILAKEVNMIPGELIGNLGDVHIYENQIESLQTQFDRAPYELPKLSINDEFWNPDQNIINQIQYITLDDFNLINYQSHPGIKIPLSN